MKYALIISMVLFLSILTSAKDTHCICKTEICRTNEAIRSIIEQLRKKASPKAVPARLLAPVILRASLRYGVDYSLLTSVLLLESRGIASAYNNRTRDYGIMQINIHTARSLGLSMNCLMNYTCSIHAGARVLSELKDGRLCRYNVGNGKLIEGRFHRCQQYERKVAGMF